MFEGVGVGSVPEVVEKCGGYDSLFLLGGEAEEAAFVPLATDELGEV